MKGGEVASLNLSLATPLLAGVGVINTCALCDWLTDRPYRSQLHACSLSLPVRCAYADKLNCPKRNAFHGRTEQWRSALGYLIVY